MLAETSGHRGGHGRYWGRGRKHRKGRKGDKQNRHSHSRLSSSSSSSSLDREEKDACRFVKDQITDSLDSSELCVSELLSAESAVPLFDDINEVLFNVRNTTQSCDVTVETESSCDQVAETAIKFSDVLRSCNVQDDFRSLVSDAFIEQILFELANLAKLSEDAQITALRQFLRQKYPGKRHQRVCNTASFWKGLS